MLVRVRRLLYNNLLIFRPLIRFLTGGTVEDRQFVVQFAVVLGTLVVVTVAVFLIARILTGEDKPDRSDPIAQGIIEERIAPVGQVYVGSVPADVTKEIQEPAQGSAGAGFASGKDVYDAVCVACHGTGVAGAPKFGDKAAWAQYLSDSIEQIYQYALNGKGAMPPKGGRADLSDDELKQAVDYMLNEVQ
jgi:cytochrome c5